MKKKICIVPSVYNAEITNKMAQGAIRVLKANNVKTLKIIKVPGAFEIPQVISMLINKYDGFVAIGCIIKGETANFNLLSSAVTNGIMKLSIQNRKPISNGLITSFTRKQATKRIDNGMEAARAVIKALKII
jgi:6,7-dimethyl-8-ribityllumazine synthase